MDVLRYAMAVSYSHLSYCINSQYLRHIWHRVGGCEQQSDWFIFYFRTPLKPHAQHSESGKTVMSE
jgi:hypothetical protein